MKVCTIVDDVRLHGRTLKKGTTVEVEDALGTAWIVAGLAEIDNPAPVETAIEKREPEKATSRKRRVK